MHIDTDRLSNISFVGAFLFLGCLQTGCGLVAQSETEPHAKAPTSSHSALQGGFVVADEDIDRTGVVNIVSSGGSSCTGTILYTSAITNHTWIITAAHCVCGTPGGVTMFRSVGNFSQMIGIFGSGIYTYDPAYTCDGSMHPHDLAVVRFPFNVPIKNNVGIYTQEYIRPVMSQAPATSFFGTLADGNTTGGDGDFFCNYTTGVGAGTSLRWGYGTFSSGNNGDATSSSLFPDGTYHTHGDSGSAWLSTSVSPLELRDVLFNKLVNNGVVMSVLDGATCILGGADWWTQATVYESSNFEFLATAMGPDLISVGGVDWQRTCWDNWCYYSAPVKAALISVATAPL